MDFLLRNAKIISLALSYDDRYGQYSAGDIVNVANGWSIFKVARYQIQSAVYEVVILLKSVRL
jgi:hypothetical protein